MQNVKIMLMGICALTLSGCFMAQKSTLVTQKVPFNPSSDAAIRLYGPYGDRQILHYADTDCDAWAEKAGSRAKSRFKNGLPRKIRNYSVGIPATPRSQKAENDTGVVFRDSYREYVLAAGRAVTLDGADSYRGDNTFMSAKQKSCRSAVSFVPKAGRYYEAAFVWEDNRCWLEVFQITEAAQAGTAPTLTPQQTQACTKAVTSF